MQLFNRPQIINEAADASMTPKKIAKGRKPGLPLILELLMIFVCFIVGAFWQSFVLGILQLPLKAAFESNDVIVDVMGIPVLDFDLLTGLLGTGAMTIFILVFMRLFQKRKARTAGYVKKNALKHYLIGLGLGAGMFAVSIGICLLTGSISIKLAPSINIPIWIAIFLGYMIQGNEEELMCRGFMMVSISRRQHVVVGLLINSLAFGLLHIWNPNVSALAIINIALFGIVMSLMFLKTGNIWMVSALHTAWNFVQGDVFGVLVSGGAPGETVLNTTSDMSKALINGGDFGLEGGLAVTIVLVLTIAVLVMVKPVKEEQTA